MPYLLQQLVSDGASRWADRDAVRFDRRALSYGELDALSNQLAYTLRESGVRRGDRVGIYMHKALESPVALYGIMKAGAAYVPLDPFAPPARLGYVIGDCGIRCLISSNAMAGAIGKVASEAPGLERVIGLTSRPALAVPAISWDDVRSAPAGAPSEGQPIEQDLAYILYTSGSTGNPKGIMHTHRSALSFAEWAAREYGLRSEDRLSNHAPLHFDLSTFDFFSAAVSGASTVIVPEGVTKFPASVSELMSSERITVWYSVPFALMQLLSRGVLEARDLSSLRWILFAGEPFPTKHLRELMARLPGIRFSNLYGPTETNVCTYYHVSSLADGSDEPIPIGQACANTEMIVVDAEDQEVMRGEPGELLVRGAIVMRGYWGRPELNQRAFFQRPVFSHYTDAFYRTGDLVAELPSGDYKLLGRKDRQIKTRGYRVELDEIEVALLSHGSVEEAAVFTLPDREGSNRIEAAVIAKSGAHVTVQELASHLAEQLPAYAVPARFAITDVLPRTSTGKIDRRELQARASVEDDAIEEKG